MSFIFKKEIINYYTFWILLKKFKAQENIVISSKQYYDCRK